MTEISTWFDFALQQMAAESYLDRLFSGELRLDQVLELGNNRVSGSLATVSSLSGQTRMTNQLLEEFDQRFQIVDHHANDSTGFSATLMREIGTNNFTLSFRSTEFESQSNGGDFERDGTLGADGDVTLQGFAFAQLAAMEDYYADLRQGILFDGTVDTELQAFFADGGKLNITGYSLGGNLATVFTELHSSEVNHTYTFNAIGRGHISGPGATEAERIAGMLQLFTAVLLDPEQGLPIITDLADPVYVAARARADQQLQSGMTFTPFESETSLGDAGNIYSDPRYLWAKNVAQVRYPTTGLVFMPPPGEVGTGSAFSQITQLYGHATDNDVEKVANRGVHGEVTSIFIEDQPDFTLLGGFFGLGGSYGTTHSLTLIVDSLATQELFQTVTPSLTQADIEAIFAASSNQSAFGFVGVAGVAEGNSLENALDALGKLFVSNYTSTPFARQTGDFGSLTFRNEFYENLAAVKNALPSGAVTIIPFVEMEVVDGEHRTLPSIAQTDFVAEAQQDTYRGLAFRYALKNLNPFAVIGPDYAALGHMSDGQLSVFDPMTGVGEMTAQYLIDRAAFLEEQIELNLVNNGTSSGDIHYKDFASGREISTTIGLGVDQEYLFGSNDLDRLEGSSDKDHLYGGAGVDLLIGNGGDDYLQGDGGGDQLDGGKGMDILVGGAGDDILEGGDNNDTLDGGLDSDILRGGVGVDRYIIRAVDGADTIEDSDGKGVLELDGQILGGALQRLGDSANTFHSADGTITFTTNGTNLVATGSGPLTLSNFTNGQFSLRLVNLPNFAQVTRTIFDKIDHYVQIGISPDGSPIYDAVYASFFNDDANDTTITDNVGRPMPAIGDANNLIHALGGDDYVVSGAGDDQLYGDAGVDQIYGGLGNDRLFGGTEDDWLYGDDGTTSASGGNDYMDGGEGNDFLHGGAGRDILLGGKGNDLISGDEIAGTDPGTSDNSGAFDDWLDGGSEDDILHGGAGSDVLIGGADNDWLIGDTTQYQNGRPEQGGNDVLDGGGGDDEIDGLYGDDLLVGGGGKDLLNGQDGSDVLYGGLDNDILSGDLRIQSVDGGYVYDTHEYKAAGGDDLLFGEEGNDIMVGGEGSDTLNADMGDDSLFGGYNMGLVSSSDPLYWTLFTASGNDWMDAGEGNDVLYGSTGSDTLLGEDGDDVLVGSGGNNVLEGGVGDDQLYGDYLPNQFAGNPFLSQIIALTGNNWLDGGPGNDDLYGGNKADTLIGGEGNDHLFGGRGADVLQGGGDDDWIIDDDPNAPAVGENETLDGGVGNDYLESWSGDDVLLGGMGNDSLVSHAGNDALFGNAGDDRLIWDNTTSTVLQTLYGGIGDDIYEVRAAGADALEFANEGTDLVINSRDPIYTLPDNIENLNTGATGIGNALDNVISATISAEGRAGDDTLTGLGQLDGGSGDDLLKGGSRLSIFSPPPPPPPGGLFGSLEPLPPPMPTIVTNTYVFDVGYGHDTIQEMDAEFNSAYYQNEDTIKFLSGITPSDISWARQGNDLELSVNGGSDRLTIQSFYDLSFNIGGYNVNGLWVPPHGFETTTLAGFPSYYAHSRVESFRFADGTVWTADHFGAPLIGDFRADAYKFSIGAGDTTVVDFDFSTPSSPEKEIDHLDLGPELSPSNLSVSIKNGADLVLSIDGTGDSFTMQSFLTSVVVFAPFSSFGYLTLPYQIEQIRFDGGAIWSVSDLYSQISTISGTTDDDNLSGNDRNNIIQGLEGDDSLSGAGGNDVLDGGLGNDTYRFNAGDGIDTVYDNALLNEGNRIQFGHGISASNLSCERIDTWLFIHVGTGDDTIRLRNFDPMGVNGSLVVQTLGFADGSTVNIADLLNAQANHVPTVGNPLADWTVPEDATFSIAIPANTFVDQDSRDVLTYTAALANGNALPTWVAFDATTQTFSGTPDDAEVGTWNLAVRATDSAGLSATSTFALTVQNVNDAPTVVNPLGNETVLEDAPFSLQAPSNTFADPDVGDGLTYSASCADGTTLPKWVSFDATTQTFHGTADDAQVGMLNLAVKATDGSGLSATSSFVLTVQNVNETPVVAVPLADQQATQGIGFTFVVPLATFADPDARDLLVYSAAQADGTALPSWMNFNATTQTFSGTPEASDVGTLNVRLTATDTGSLTAADDFALTIAPSGGTAGNDSLIGTRGNDLLNGLGGDDVLQGLAGNDTLLGGPGNDLLDGGLGADSMNGGTGNDTYVIDSAADLVNENPNEGTDTVQSDTAYTLGANVENLTLTGTAAINGTGNALKNVLNGNSGNNLLDGGTGADTLVGGFGNDTYVVDNAADVVTENSNEGTDTVQSSLTYALGANVENLTLTGTMAINGTGNAINNVFVGNSANNVLTGGAGNDRLDGGAGNDTLLGGSGDDTYIVNQTGDVVSENANEGTDTVESSIAYALGANVENLTLIGTASLAGVGNTLNNFMIGNSGGNAMDGGTGNDTLDGGTGNDTLQGGSGDDTVLGGAGDDVLSGGSGNDILDGGDGTDTLDGGSGDDMLRGAAGNDILSGGSGADQLTGGTGNDTLAGGSGNDLYNFSRGDGQDRIGDADGMQGNQDRLLFGATINPLDLVISRQANDLRLAIHGTTDAITIQNWYTSPSTNQLEDLQAGNSQHLLNTQVDQLIQAMASFGQQTGLTWDQAIDQRPQEVQTVLAASWH
jgi:Ca2+-binding RTX toxin-like protein